MDNIDRVILKKLEDNCRISYTLLASELNVTPKTAKNRISKMIDDDTITEFYCDLSCLHPSISQILSIVTMKYIDEPFTEFENNLKNNPFVERIGKLSEYQYVVGGLCRTIDDMTVYNSVFAKNSYVDNFETHILKTHNSHSLNITHLQKEVIKVLCNNPRKSYSDIARMIGKSPKGVRLALNRLLDFETLRFTIKVSIPTYFVKLNYYEKKNIQSLSHQRINSDLVWKYHLSLSDSSLFVFFFFENPSDLSNIRNIISGISYGSVDFSAVCEPMKYFDKLQTGILMDAFE